MYIYLILNFYSTLHTLANSIINYIKITLSIILALNVPKLCLHNRTFLRNRKHKV